MGDDRKIEAVIFDMDGVLTDSEPLINAATVSDPRRLYDYSIIKASIFKSKCINHLLNEATTHLGVSSMPEPTDPNSELLPLRLTTNFDLRETRICGSVYNETKSRFDEHIVACGNIHMQNEIPIPLPVLPPSSVSQLERSSVVPSIVPRTFSTMQEAFNESEHDKLTIQDELHHLNHAMYHIAHKLHITSDYTSDQDLDENEDEENEETL